MKRTGKTSVTTVILVILLIAGLSLLLYPTFSNWWNQSRSTRAVNDYQKTIEDMGADEKEKALKSAEAYNAKLVAYGYHTKLTSDEKKAYNKELRNNDVGVMGFLDIPKLRVSLPIFHGTSETVLKRGVGHVEWSSLPVGGKSTHCVISGHRGLPSAKLLSDLDVMKEGDIFTLNVLDRTMTYEVDQIRVVVPKDVTGLVITKDKDYCTLVTCTPYGVNTHRLLVRGHRIKNIYDTSVVNEAILAEPAFVAGGMAILILLVLLSVVIGKTGNRTRKRIKEKRRNG